MTCNYDVIEIKDGRDSSSDLIGEFCGKTKPDEITSTTNQLYIRFKSDHSVNEVGFNATWKSIGKEICKKVSFNI